MSPICNFLPLLIKLHLIILIYFNHPLCWLVLAWAGQKIISNVLYDSSSNMTSDKNWSSIHFSDE